MPDRPVRVLEKRSEQFNRRFFMTSDHQSRERTFVWSANARPRHFRSEPSSQQPDLSSTLSGHLFHCPNTASGFLFNLLLNSTDHSATSQPANPSPPPIPPEFFNSKRQAVRWMIDTNTKHHKRAKTTKNDPTRVRFVCAGNGCDYSFNVRKNSAGVFVTTRWRWHTCDPFSNPETKRSWVQDQARVMLRTDERLNAVDLQQSLRVDLGVHANLESARKALSSARKMNDVEDARFEQLPGLFRVLAERNPGTVADVVCDEGRFSMAFLCPGPCARAWQFCPRLIALDAAHGTSSYKGVIMVATALDGADQIFPLRLGLFRQRPLIPGGSLFLGSFMPSKSQTHN